jgi:glycosyl hydrolase family 59 (putative galactocerebrosidase)
MTCPTCLFRAFGVTGVVVLIAACGRCRSDEDDNRQSTFGGPFSTISEVPTPCDFEGTWPGRDPSLPPEGFFVALTGSGNPGRWVVREDPNAPAGWSHYLTHVSEEPSEDQFPLCIQERSERQDVRVTVRFDAIAGKIDQAAGVVARFRDANNYYLARANALEDNVRLYRVVDGARRQFAGADCEVSAGEWHSLALEIKGQHFRVSFNGKLLFEADDGTFASAGLAGLWTKADSVTYFDDLLVERL